MPSTIDDRLGHVGGVLWLAAKATALALLATVLLLFALSALGSVTAWLATLGGVAVLLAVGYALFGDWEWAPDGEARQHATFLVLLVGLNVALRALVDSLVGTPPASPVTAFLRLFVGLCLLALAGWLAYFDGLSRLRSLVTLGE